MKNPFDFRVLAQWVPPFNKLMEQHAIRLPLQNMALENKQNTQWKIRSVNKENINILDPY